LRRENESAKIPSNVDELAQMGREFARPYIREAARGKLVKDDVADKIIDQQVEELWVTWLPRIVKLLCVLVLCCCCFAAVRLARRQVPKAGHQS